MNSKGEWGSSKIPRLTIEVGEVVKQTDFKGKKQPIRTINQYRRDFTTTNETPKNPLPTNRQANHPQHQEAVPATSNLQADSCAETSTAHDEAKEHPNSNYQDCTTIQQEGNEARTQHSSVIATTSANTKRKNETPYKCNSKRLRPAVPDPHDDSDDQDDQPDRSQGKSQPAHPALRKPPENLPSNVILSNQDQDVI